PSQVEEHLLTIEGLTPHYLCVLTRPGRMDELTVQVEAASASSTPEQRAGMARDLAARIKHRIGVTVRVEVLDPHSLERSLGKAKRISDQRHLR
ncbi:MAG TPA: phenylacetate--CoA ligase, partial [Pedococcus sp.]|nr:phenylacetate--CoA ligase [Pedococcus sp.]